MSLLSLLNPSSYLFISCFTVSVFPSINTPEFSGKVMILIISSITSFKMNKVNSFPSLTTPCALIFLSKLSATDKVALVANLGKINLVNQTAKSNSAFFV